MSPRSAPRRPVLRAVLLTCLMTSSLAACATRSSTREVQTVAASAASLKTDVPQLAREKCEGAELPPRVKAGEADYQIFGMRQTAKLEQCEFKRALGVEASDLHNQYVEKLVQTLSPKPWWQRLFGR